MLHHLLAYFEIQKYYKNKPKFNGVYSRNNLPITKNEGICNKSDGCKSKGTHCTTLHVNT